MAYMKWRKTDMVSILLEEIRDFVKRNRRGDSFAVSRSRNKFSAIFVFFLVVSTALFLTTNVRPSIRCFSAFNSTPRRGRYTLYFSNFFIGTPSFLPSLAIKSMPFIFHVFLFALKARCTWSDRFFSHLLILYGSIFYVYNGTKKKEVLFTDYVFRSIK